MRQATTGLPAWRASETLTSKPSRVESCNAILEFCMRALSTGELRLIAYFFKIVGRRTKVVGEE